MSIEKTPLEKQELGDYIAKRERFMNLLELQGINMDSNFANTLIGRTRSNKISDKKLLEIYKVFREFLLTDPGENNNAQENFSFLTEQYNLLSAFFDGYRHALRNLDQDFLEELKNK